MPLTPCPTFPLRSRLLNWLSSLGLLTYNYVNQEGFSEFCFAMNVILMFGPALVFIAYDMVNRRLEQFNAAVLEIVWEGERHRHEKELASLDVEKIIDLNEVKRGDDV